MTAPRLAVVAVLAAAALALPTTPAPAAGDPVPTTCHGEDATFILVQRDDTLAGPPPPGATVYRGYPEPMPVATAGRDVVVTAGVAFDTLGGDDLVCAVRPASAIDTGDGADTVDATAVVGSAKVRLGPGDDSYTGGSGADAVATGAGSDTVTTGPGDDVVDTQGSSGGTVDLGEGDDELVSGGPVSSATGGPGADSLALTVPTPGSTLAVDVPAGTSTINGAVTRITGFEQFRTVSLERGQQSSLDYLGSTEPVFTLPWASLSFRGSDAEESLDLTTLSNAQIYPSVPDGFGPVDIDLGGGPDHLVMDQATHGALRGGGGSDELALGRVYGTGRGPVRLDLARKTLRISSEVPRSTVAGFEGVILRYFHDADVVGSNRAEAIDIGTVGSGNGPAPRVDGRGGDDVIHVGDRSAAVASGGPGDDTLVGGRHGDRLSGGPGDDHLDGRRGRDHLVGGPGRDRAVGGVGRDTCEAERTSGC